MRAAIAIHPDYAYSHIYLIVALALTGHESQAHEALRRYLALPNAFAHPASTPNTGGSVSAVYV